MPPRPRFPIRFLRSSPLHHLHHRHHATQTSPPSRHPLTRLLPTWKPILLSLGIFLTWVPAFEFIHSHVFQIMSVTGPSMYPFLNTDYNTSIIKDQLFVNMWSPHQNLRRGMLVAFWSPLHPEVLAIKRVVALEGDSVVTKAPYSVARVDVPVGHVWVEGEHPMSLERSYDSNYYGPVSKSLIVGRAMGVVWPWGRRGRIRWEDWRGNGRVVEGVNEVEEVKFY